MTKWKCSDCESQFYDPDTVLYRAGRIGNGSENWEKDEYIDVCPVCGSTEIYEAYFCDDCEKEAEKLDEDDLCPECAARAEEAVSVAGYIPGSRWLISAIITFAKIARQNAVAALLSQTAKTR